MDQLPHPRRREGKLARLDPERAERGGNRVGDDAADRNDAALARALGAERIVGRGFFFERDRPDARKVACRRQEIVGERAREQLSVFIVDEMLQERAAETLHDGAHDLAVQGQRVDDAPGVLDRDIVEEFHVAGLRSEEHTSELQSQSISYAVFCLKKKKKKYNKITFTTKQNKDIKAYDNS